ncbi:hypothetical protein NA56DRAFT_478788 [Hyaloscypha hepaticicola]|uniref:Uncharacterized protein n=1 Tax=Hyaloscypha hepaticicola TaxID=2082293 RepID=A0A2J6PF24_9HELO|nr:hypothetical protein NA56DRAFT_478788 [Hyaloscypha hepaticicola]
MFLRLLWCFGSSELDLLSTSGSRGTLDVLFLQTIQSEQLGSQFFSYSLLYTSTCTVTLTPASLESLLEAKIQLTLSSCKNKLTLQERTCYGRQCGEALTRFGSATSFRGGFDVPKTYSWDLESDFDAQLAHSESEATIAAFRDRRQEDRVEHAGDMLSINFSLTVTDLQHRMMKYPASVLNGELYPGKFRPVSDWEVHRAFLVSISAKDYREA